MASGEDDVMSRRATEDAYEYEFPVSPVQSRLLVLDSLRPGGAEYNVPVAFAVTGPLDVEALLRAVRRLVERHEALRTTFRAEDGAYVQVVAEQATAETAIVRGLRWDQVSELLSAEAFRPFDLRHGPLLRCVVYELGDSEFCVLLTAHHLVCDGWSLRVLLAELGACYAGLAAEALPAPAIQYPDYASWQHDWRAAGAFDEGIAYWTRVLDGAPGLLDLPTDFPRPAIQSNRGAAVAVPLPKGTRERVAELAAELGVTAHSVLLAAFDVFLARVSGRSDLVVGVPVAGRDHHELQDVVGMLVNTLATRALVPEDLAFRELVRQVGAAMVASRPFHDVPFDSVVAATTAERRLSHDPLVQVVLSYEDDTETRLDLAGARVTRLDIPPVTAKFDLTVTLNRVGDELVAEFCYRTELFAHATMRDWARAFATLLTRLIDAPDEPVGAVDPLDDAARARLLRAGVGASRPVLGPTVPELIAAHATDRPSALALVFGELRLTYRELLRRADQLAGWLRRAGIGAETAVGLCFPRGAELPIAALAVLRAGGAFVPFDAEQPAARLRSLIADSGIRLLLTTTQTAPLAKGAGAPVVVLAPGAAALLDPREPLPDAEPPACVPRPDNLAYLLYTSGSTGVPKAVAVEHRSLRNLALAVRHDMAVAADDRVLQYTSFGFDVVVADIVLTWTAGATLEVAAEHERLGDALLARLRDSGITSVFLPPVAAMSLPHTDEAKATLARLRVLSIGGEALPPALVDRWWAPDRLILNAYGPTEATVYAAVARPRPGEPVAIGTAVANTAVRVLDARLRLVPAGVVGEIHLTGAGLARGYLRRPALTAERFVADPYGPPGSRLYRTGDLGRLTADGTLYYLGRSDRQVKVRGFRVELGEIESVLTSHQDVRAAAATVTGPAGDRRVIAYAVPAGEVLPPAATLRAWLAERLPGYMLPERIVELDELPLNPSGKLDRERLPQPPNDRADLDGTRVPPRTATERRLADMWATVLHTNAIGRTDNFFDLGGNSIRLLTVLTALRAAHDIAKGRDLTLVDLFAHPNIADLAAFLDDADEPSASVEADTARRRGARHRARIAGRRATTTDLEHRTSRYPEGDDHD